MAEQQQRHLPHDLITNHILTKLPIKSLIQFKSVSKQWYSTLNSPQFAHTFLKLSPSFHPTSPIQFLFIKTGKIYCLYGVYAHENDDEISQNLVKLGFDFDVDNDNDEKLDLIGSCNGVVCLASSFGSFFILWNPIIGKFRKYLDNEIIIDKSNPCQVSWGFGYVSSVDDYKVVRIIELGATLEIRVHVFSLKSNKWTRIADELFLDVFSLRGNAFLTCQFRRNETISWYPVSFHLTRGVLVDETLYWIVSKISGDGIRVVSFDLVCEKFDAMTDWNLRKTVVYEDMFLCVMGGCLSKCGINLRGDFFIDMLKCPGSVETIRLYGDLGINSCTNLVGFTRTGKFFILTGSAKLGLVDPSSDPMKCKQLVEFHDSTTCVASLVPSLTLPYTMGKSSGY